MSKAMLMIVATHLVGCAPGEIYRGDQMNSPDPWRKGPAVYRELPLGDARRQHLCQVEPDRPGCVLTSP